MNADIKNIIFMLISFVLLVLLLSACDRETCCVDPFTLYSISGIVTDSLTDLPVDSALVTRDDTTTTGVVFFTDTSGFYEVVAIGGNYTIIVRKAGYLSKSKQVLLNSNLTNVNFTLVIDTTK